MTRLRLVAATSAVTALLAACTSSGTSGQPTAGGPTTPPASQTTSASPTDTTPTDTPTTVASTSATTSVKPTPAGDDCTAAQLSIRVLPSSGAQQQEFALITFTNSSTTECSLLGYPGVSLRLNNALLGSPAQRNVNTAAARVHLAPGKQAKAMITDFSACQAPLSDTVRIYPPNLTTFIDRPTQLRGCQLVVDAVSPA